MHSVPDSTGQPISRPDTIALARNTLFKTDIKRVPSLEAIKKIIEKFWNLDAISVEQFSDHISSYNFEEMEALKLVDQGSYYDKSTQRWYVSIPWKDKNHTIGDNYGASFEVMKSVERSVIKKNCISDVNDAYNEILFNNFSRKVSFDELRKNTSEPVSYIPSFAVFTPGKESTKVRIVMNCSAKSATGSSLNDLILAGPSLIPDLTNMLIKFRTGRYAMCFDIAKMFLQIKLASEKDQRFFRYLWRNGKTSDAPCEYQMTSLLFGLNCSPFIANFVVKNMLSFFHLSFLWEVPSQNPKRTLTIS